MRSSMVGAFAIAGFTDTLDQCCVVRMAIVGVRFIQNRAIQQIMHATFDAE